MPISARLRVGLPQPLVMVFFHLGMHGRVIVGTRCVFSFDEMWVSSWNGLIDCIWNGSITLDGSFVVLRRFALLVQRHCMWCRNQM